MRCSKCGNEIDLNARFCRVCGNALNNVSVCVVCGKEIAPGKKVCRDCLKQQKKENNNILLKVLVILLSIIIMLMLGMGGIWFWCEWQDIFYTKEVVSYDDNGGQVIYNTNNNQEQNETGEEKIWDEPYFENLRASSEYEPYMLENGNIYTYYIEQIRDNNHNTAWTPEEWDKTPWIKFSDESEQKVKGIIIENGYSKTEDLYYQNLRAKDILIECDDFEMRFMLSDRGCQVPEKVEFERPVITKNIKITVLSTYESIKIDGIKFEDLSITEIEIY